MVVAEHSAEMCPEGIVRPKPFTPKLEASLRKSGVKVVDGYVDGPGHIWYLILEADDYSTFNTAVEPLRLIGTVHTSPVMKLSEALAWAKKIGMQE